MTNRINDKDIQDIIDRVDKGESKPSIGASYGVTSKTIYNIYKKHSKAHVEMITVTPPNKSTASKTTSQLIKENEKLRTMCMNLLLYGKPNN